MQLIIPPEVVQKLIIALRRAGPREIGGILMGEHVGPDTFCLNSLTIQRRGGTFSAFMRMAEDIVVPLKTFFRKTQHNYTRFNYLGEWHSHHSFALSPTSRDQATMYELAIDPQLGAHFVILLLVRLDDHDRLEVSATVYQPDKPPVACSIVQTAILDSNFWMPGPTT
jgi:hypothetical protein